MRIFITGVGGFVGSHLADRFLANGDTVVGIDNLSGGYKDNIPYGVDFYKSDCLDREFIESIMMGCDVVYHCAAYAYEGLSVFSPHIVTKNVFGATTSVLSAAVSCRVKRFIYMSSMARYGNQEVPFTEDMIPMPQDPYGIAKVASEEMVKNLCSTHGIDYVIVVPHNIIGARQKYDDPYRNVVSIMINRMLQGNAPIIYGDGMQKRCFSFIQDVINPLELCATSKEVVGEIINIGPDEEFITIKKLASMLSDILDFKGNPIYVKQRPQEVKFATCSADKARKLLDYKTTTRLEFGILDIINYIEDRGVLPFNYHIPLEIISDLTPNTWKEKLI